MTTLPFDYPRGYTFPRHRHAIRTDFDGRVVNFSESLLGDLVKGGDRILDISKFSGGDATHLEDLCRECSTSRRPPLTPAVFRAELEGKTPSLQGEVASECRAMARLYESAFIARLGAATELCYDKLGWGDKEMFRLSEVVNSGALRHLNTLSLNNNAIRGAGLKALVLAVRSCSTAALPKLEYVRLDGNPSCPIQRIQDMDAALLFRRLKLDASVMQATHEQCAGFLASFQAQARDPGSFNGLLTLPPGHHSEERANKYTHRAEIKRQGANGNVCYY